jgi:hypothetical protein
VSSDVSGEPAELGPVMGRRSDTGVLHGAELVAFAEAVVGDGDDLAGARAELLERIGPDGLVDAAAVVAGFDATDRIADATGTQLDDYLERGTVELRAELGIDELASLGE